MPCCCCSATKSCLTLCDPVDCNTLGFPVLHYLPEFAQIHVHWVDDAIQTSHPLPPPYSFAFSLSLHQGLFQSVDSSHQVAKVLELQLQLQHPPNEYSGLISFRIEWFDLLAVQGTLRSLLQHKSSKVSILQHSAFFIVQLPTVIHTWLQEKLPTALAIQNLLAKWCLCFLTCCLDWS